MRVPLHPFPVLARLLAFFVLSFVYCACPAHARVGDPVSRASDLEAGFAARDIKIETETPIGGYGFGNRRKILAEDVQQSAANRAHLFKPAIGQLDPIRAKALLLQSGDKKLLFVSLDLLMLPQVVYVKLLREIESLGFAEDEIFINAVHTHSGPGAYSGGPLWEVAVLDLFVDDVYQRVAAAVREAVTEAQGKLERAALYKSYFDATGIQKNRSEPDGPMDPRARVLYVQSASGRWMGALVNYGVHGTALRDDNLFLSSDVPGSIERSMEDALAARNRPRDAKPVALFVSAAAGDIDPAENGYAFVLQAGKKFRDQAMRNFGDLQPVSSVWQVSSQAVAMNEPYFRSKDCRLRQTAAFRTAASRLDIPLNWLVPHMTKIWEIRLGEIRFLTFPGELTTALHEEYVQSLPGPASADDEWFLEMTNDYLLYFVTQADYDQLQSIENCLSVYGPAGSAVLLRAYQALLGERAFR